MARKGFENCDEGVVQGDGGDDICQQQSVWLTLRASLYEAQIGLGARLVSAEPPSPCASLAPNPPHAPC